LLRKISKAGVVTTVEFKDQFGSILTNCHGLAVDANGNLYVANRQAHIIQKVTPAGVITTIAGKRNEIGPEDGPRETARFFNPTDLVLDKAGNLYVVDGNNEMLRRISPTGQVVTLAGQSTGLPSQVDGRGRAARFANLRSLAVDDGGKVYALDKGVLRVVTSDGVVSTLAGHATGNGSRKDGTGAAASFSYESIGMVMDARGTIYVGDGPLIRAVTKEGVVSTFAGYNTGHADGVGKAAMFDTIRGLAIDASGHLIVADGGNHAIRKVSPEAVVTTIAGQPPNPGNADGIGEAARFHNPAGLAIDVAGHLFVADSNNWTVRKVTPEGLVTTFVGYAQRGGYVDATGDEARFRHLFGLVIDKTGTLYVSDNGNSLIRKITSAGAVSTLAGKPPANGERFTGNTDGAGPNARFSFVDGLALSESGTLFLSTGQHCTIRQVTQDGGVKTVGGLLDKIGYQDGTLNDARFSYPKGLFIDSGGALYVADSANRAIRKITPAGSVTTVFRFGEKDPEPRALTIDKAGNIYVVSMMTIHKITPAGVMTTIGGTANIQGGADGLGAAAKFDSLHSIVVSPTGVLYVTDVGNNCIFRGVPVEPAGGKP
jgi:sugar lactone lactonase YvrE